MLIMFNDLNIYTQKHMSFSDSKMAQAVAEVLPVLDDEFKFHCQLPKK